MAAPECVDRASTPGDNGSLLSHLKHAGGKELEAAGVDLHTVRCMCIKMAADWQRSQSNLFEKYEEIQIQAA